MTILLCIVLSISCGCEQESPKSINLFAKQDSTPPKLLQAKAIDSLSVTLKFSEEVRKAPVSLKVNGVENTQCSIRGDTLIFTLRHPMEVASPTQVEGRVEDLWGNSTRFELAVWPNNPNRASVIINEFSTKGSANNPDRVELLVTRGGNLAGLTITNGVGAYTKDRCILGDEDVHSGDFIVIDFQMGKTKSPYASEKLGGISSNNGCLAVCESPDWESPIIDAVLYSNRTTSTHGGFGSQETEKAAHVLSASRQWNSPLAEKAIDSTHSTSTRTLCRDSYKDTNSEQDWYVCDTGEASFGRENSSKRYVK